MKAQTVRITHERDGCLETSLYFSEGLQIGEKRFHKIYVTSLRISNSRTEDIQTVAVGEIGEKMRAVIYDNLSSSRRKPVGRAVRESHFNALRQLEEKYYEYMG